jgi:hypothetical protein
MTTENIMAYDFQTGHHVQFKDLESDKNYVVYDHSEYLTEWVPIAYIGSVE